MALSRRTFWDPITISSVVGTDHELEFTEQFGGPSKARAPSGRFFRLPVSPPLVTDKWEEIWKEVVMI
jgi:hypothetical protein